MKGKKELTDFEKGWKQGFRKGIVIATLASVFTMFAYHYVEDVAEEFNKIQKNKTLDSTAITSKPKTVSIAG